LFDTSRTRALICADPPTLTSIGAGLTTTLAVGPEVCVSVVPDDPQADRQPQTTTPSTALEARRRPLTEVGLQRTRAAHVPKPG
jgi:hypothetical protein